MVVLAAALKTIRLFGLLIWAYLAGNSITHPVTLGMPLTHFSSWPHEDVAALAGFVGSLVASGMLALLHSPKSDPESS